MKLLIELETREKNAFTHYPSKFKFELDGDKKELEHCIVELKKIFEEILEKLK